MTDELHLDRKRGLRVGFRVQLAEANSATDEEGILREIFRLAPRQHFRFAVEWPDGSMKSYSYAQIVRSNYADYVQWDSPTARQQTWQAGNAHYWILFGDSRGSSCLFCGRMRQLLDEHNNDACRGPVKIGFR